MTNLVDAQREMTACDARASHAECLLRAVERTTELSTCGRSSSSFRPSTRACLLAVHERLSPSDVACLEAQQWALAACMSEAACEAPRMTACNEAYLSELSLCELDDVAYACNFMNFF